MISSCRVFPCGKGEIIVKCQFISLFIKQPNCCRSLSQSLRGIQIVHDPSHIVLVDNHRARLRQLVTAVGDYMARRSLPAAWLFECLNNHRLVEPFN